MQLLEWDMVEEGKKTPVEVNVHHTIEYLGDIHSELSAIHRQHEQKVNYFEAMVKNAVTVENARIIRVNADEQARVDKINESNRAMYDTAMKSWNTDRTVAQYAFNELRQKEIEHLAGLRIEVPARFQPVVDEFLKGLE
jgi:succinylglutamate desuccinylase